LIYFTKFYINNQGAFFSERLADIESGKICYKLVKYLLNFHERLYRDTYGLLETALMGLKLTMEE